MPSRPSTEQRLFGAVSPCGKPDERRLVVFGFVTRSRRSHEAERLRFISSLTFGESLPGSTRTASAFAGAGRYDRAGQQRATECSPPPKRQADFSEIAAAIQPYFSTLFRLKCFTIILLKYIPLRSEREGGALRHASCVQCSVFTERIKK